MLKGNLGYFYSLLAAILFGASTPAAKVLLGTIDPLLLAGLLYLGSSVGLSVIFFIQIASKEDQLKESLLKYRDFKWLAGAILFGGIIGPILLMVGLVRTSAASASLLLNLESVFSAIIAWLVFKEHTNPKIVFGAILIVIGCLILSWKGNVAFQNLFGPLLIAGACLCWAIDNNLTQKIAAANPIQISMIKCFIAGLTNTVLALILGALLPNFMFLISASMVGLFGYGLSLLFFILGLRNIGTARASAYFSVAPFVGTGIAIIFLHESVSIQLIVASIFMAAGIWIHLTEYHSHAHQHDELEHEHRHIHDEHHQHTHLFTDPLGEPHTHTHKHIALLHSHPHYPDTHHRHKH